MPSEFDAGIATRKAIYIPFPQAVPNAYLVDESACTYVQSDGKKCGACAKKCPKDCIDLDEQGRGRRDRGRQHHRGHGLRRARRHTGSSATATAVYPNVLTALEFERLTNASGPTGGKIVAQDRSAEQAHEGRGVGVRPRGAARRAASPSSTASGSRDTNYNPYCSRVCCMYSLKFAHLVTEKLPDATCYEFYIDMRAFGKGYEEFFERIKAEGTFVVRGRSATVIEHDGQMIVKGEDILSDKMVEFPVDMVLLAVGLVPAARHRTSSRGCSGIPRDEDGWFTELDYNADPTGTERGGIFVAGVCQGPKDIPDTVAQASAVAAGVLKSIVSGKGVDSLAEPQPRRHRGAGQEPGDGVGGERMAIRVNPKLIDELEMYGAEDVSKCYHCGNCSAVCPFSRDPYIFPRKSMRYLQMGLEEKLKGGLEPWLCYYCGECSEQCPRDAEPGETMMSLRRWLTSRYDFTGISRLSTARGAGSSARSLLVGVAHGLGLPAVRLLAREASPTTTARTPSCPAPDPCLRLVAGDAAAGAAAQQRARMWWFTIGRDRAIRVPLRSYVTQGLPAARCTSSPRSATRSASASGPGLIAPGADAQLRDHAGADHVLPAKHGSPGPGSTGRCTSSAISPPSGCWAPCISPCAVACKKTSSRSTSTRTRSDWIFLVLLLVVALTGICSTSCTAPASTLAANITYVVHLMVVVPMLGARGALQQVVAPGLPPAGHVLRRRAGGGARTDGSRRRCRPKACRPREEVTAWKSHGSASTSATAAPTSPRSSTATRSLSSRRRCPASPSRARTSTCAPTPARR